VYGNYQLTFDDFMCILMEYKKNEKLKQDLQEHSTMEAEFLGGEGSVSETSKPESWAPTMEMLDLSDRNRANFWADTPEGQQKAQEFPPNPPKEKKPAPSRWITGDSGMMSPSDDDKIGTGGSRPVTPAAEEDFNAFDETRHVQDFEQSTFQDTANLTVEAPITAVKTNATSLTSGRVTGRQMVPPPQHPGRVADVDVYGNPRSKAIRMKPRHKGEMSGSAMHSVHCEVVPVAMLFGMLEIGRKYKMSFTLRNVGQSKTRFRIQRRDNSPDDNNFCTVLHKPSFDIAAGMKVKLEVEVTTGTLGEINDQLEVQSEFEKFSIPVTAKVVNRGDSKGRLAKGVVLL